ncbi:MAG TPA: L,D-transpeptidase [Acidimicrobiales bacterium]|jgi:lipoprotein-anchoring transpeptidase ErfK/SrfK|nr:L,D-transpeptidase [Acidimicrobiales bacterium]HWI04288.1 L,D-transpeptidase [Acidimicrobiales bacterium]
MRRTLVAAVLVAALFSWVAGAGQASASEYSLEIDISEQVLLEVVDGQVVSATHVSTGNGEWYRYEGEWWRADTPRGWFRIYAKDAGWHEGSLGWLYNAMYFVGGFAIHGSTSVPDYPASHGCVRVTLEDSDYFFDRVPIGTWVHVHD